MLKITISYNMLAGREQECQEFLINRFTPGLSRLGFNVSEVWFTVWGNSPQVLGGGHLETIEQAKKIFLSKEWKKLADVMNTLSHDFKVSFVRVPDIEDDDEEYDD